MFGSDSSKSTQFGLEVDTAIGFTCLPGAKTSAYWQNQTWPTSGWM